MSFGARIGPRIGPRFGPRVGSGFAVPDPMAGVSRDALSGKYCPATLAEWNIVLAVAGWTYGAPSMLWLLQESSGNALDSIGAFPGTVTGGTRQRAQAGWTRVGFGTTDNSSDNIATTDAGLPDILTTSLLDITYLGVPASTSQPISTVSQFGTLFGADATMRTGSDLKAALTTGVGTTAGAATFLDGGVHPIATQINKATGFANIVTDQETVTRTATGAAGKRKMLGGEPAQAYRPITANYLYSVSFFATAAEAPVSAIKTLLRTLNWTVA